MYTPGDGGSVVQIHCRPLDVTDESSVAPFFQQIVDEFGSCDLLVNNAGIAVGGPLEEISG